jgi:transcriptional regulator with PAS, ATPase and Fis domain
MSITSSSSVSSLVQSLGEIPPEAIVFGHSEGMQALRDRMDKVASANVPVLIQGESGTGKDIIARMIHGLSPWKAGPFVKVNCPAIPGTLLESELFGYEKGAFSGATTSKPGKFELADKGTLFLDEIGDIPPSIQVKLLRVLQEREFERLGGTKTLKVDVRLIAATNRDLRAALEDGTFREDLYYRLNVVAIDIPPLRDHKEDIPALANFFLEKFSRESGKPVRGINPAALRLLMDFHWPGNVRELENILERGVTLSSGSMLDAADIHLDSIPTRSTAGAPAALPDGMTLDQWEDQAIREALHRANGNKSQAARALGLSRNALRYRLSKIGVPDPSE